MADRLQNIEASLRSVDEVRRKALAAGDRRRAARAEDLIVQMEQQITALAAQAKQSAETQEEGLSEQSQMQRPHIFAINGDPDFLNVVRVLLQDERYNVTTTNFVPRTFDQIAALQPSLLLVDLAIGKQAGWELLERLHEETSTRNIPLIVVSNDPELLDRARKDEKRYGGENFIAKPLDLDELFRTIRSLTGGTSLLIAHCSSLPRMRDLRERNAVMSGGSMRIKRLQHVSISIEAGREDEARRFYGEALGLKEKPRPMGLKDRALIWYDIGEDAHEIHLLRTDPAELEPSRAADHLCIEVDDIAAMRAHLNDRHVPIRETSVIDNRPRFFVEDPFGNSIELVQVTGAFTPVDE